MSITKLLNDPLGKEFRERMKREFPSPKFNMNADLKVLPRSNDYSITGSAFDYLLRFTIERNTDKKKVEKSNRALEKGYDLLLIKLRRNKATKILSGNGNREYDRYELLNLIEILYADSMKNYNTYLKKGKVNRQILQSCVFFAKLDLYAKRHYLHDNIESPELEIMWDLEEMINIVDLKNFKAKKKCYLNPVFGAGFTLCSDGDLILDDTLIDIKTTRKDKLQRVDFNQLLGYYLLSLISGPNGSPPSSPIKKIGIYFARYGVLWKMPLEDLGNEEKFDELKSWLLRYPPFDFTRTIKI